MQILRRGKIPDELTYTHTCKRCSTYFRFSYREGTRVSDQRDGDYLSVECPVCKDICTEAI